MLKGKVLVAQGGGPTVVINQSLAGVILKARGIKGVSHIYGARHGVSGIITQDFLNLTREPAANLE
ncbi:MAG: 6-phosphofructokinase, partial [Rhodospirillaceae bacterium]|nr:6-phosphofructokinase [Rhodospirillaceae bacterium]